jgi:hypothetical protein
MGQHEPSRSPSDDAAVRSVARHLPAVGSRELLVRQELLIVDVGVTDKQGIPPPRQAVVLAVTGPELGQATG